MYKQNKLKKEIEELNETLEKRVKEEVENNRIKDVELFKQSKAASMGKMIRNIAHQWRQPLNRVNLSLSIIKTVHNEQNSEEVIEKKIQQAEKNIRYMSDTIDDFMNFFKPDKRKDIFCVADTISKALKLIDNRSSKINVKVLIPKEIEVFNYKNEYLQVLLIILNNAIDNFNITNVPNKEIVITYIEDKDSIKILIKDNSGGIEEDNIENIFEPYFTTKFKKEGTGLGLYMAKILVEDSMNGILSVKSSDGASTFTITLKK